MRRFIKSLGDWNREGVLSVVGTTGSGKTAAVIEFLRQNSLTDTLLVNVDSISAYCELDIGSAKVMGADREDFHWIGIDEFLPTEKIDAAAFKTKVYPQIIQALEAKKPVILVGGSHFYERYLVEGASLGESSDPEFQESLEKKASEDIAEDIIEKDSRFQEKIKLTDRYRLTRLADLVLRQKLNFEDLFLKPKKDSLLSFTTTYIHSGEKNLEKIHLRVEEMFHQGWVEEVQALIEKYGPDIPSLEATGYKEIRHMLIHQSTLQECVELVKIRHAQLAKKQRTWLRKLKRPSP